MARLLPFLVAAACLFPAHPAPAADAGTNTAPCSLAETILKIKPSIVGIGTLQATRRPPKVVAGTGFVVGNGNTAITNAHVIPDEIDERHFERLVIFTGPGDEPKFREARVIRSDADHDLAVLSFSGAPLPALALGDDASVREGDRFAFTGFPLGAVLGLYPATHRGIVSAITPIATPANHSRQIDKNILDRLSAPYSVFQLDATAYPGNSGSPLYEVCTGKVVGVINKVFVKGTKEYAITNPSGITYAIPVRHVKDLLEK